MKTINFESGNTKNVTLSKIDNPWNNDLNGRMAFSNVYGQALNRTKVEKIEKLLALSLLDSKKTIVCCSTLIEVKYYKIFLRHLGVRANSVTGNTKQENRMDYFESDKITITTDKMLDFYLDRKIRFIFTNSTRGNCLLQALYRNREKDCEIFVFVDKCFEGLQLSWLKPLVSWEKPLHHVIYSSVNCGDKLKKISKYLNH